MNINGKEFLIGADPEMFVRCIETGKFVSAHGMVPGTKDEPYKVPFGAIQVDGMAVEFNIDPAANEGEFVHNVKAVMKSLASMIGSAYELVPIPTCFFGKDLIDAQPSDAKELGCEPDFCAWTGEQNPVPNVETPYRTGSGHIHIGWTEGQDVANPDHLSVCEYLVRNLDYFCSPTLVEDRDTTRRNLYGSIGAYRPKPYGVEYRTPSNYWLTSEKTIRDIYRLVVSGIEECVMGRAPIASKESYMYDTLHTLYNVMDFDGDIELYDLLEIAQDAGVDYAV